VIIIAQHAKTYQIALVVINNQIEIQLINACAKMDFMIMDLWIVQVNNILYLLIYY
jgi:hypothetical protein